MSFFDAFYGTGGTMLMYIGCYAVTVIVVYLMLRKPIENGLLTELKVRPWGFIAKFKEPR